MRPTLGQSRRGRRWGATAAAVVARVWHKMFADRILGMAAEAGFWAIVSLPALLLTLLGAVGYLRGVIGASGVARIHEDVLRAARDVLTPATVDTDIAPLLNQVLSGGHLAVVSIGFVISLWSGSTAMSDYVNTITVAYGMRGLRSAWRSRVVAVVLYLCFVAVGVVLLPALALGPNALIGLAPDAVADVVSTTVHVAYWPVVALLSVALLDHPLPDGAAGSPAVAPRAAGRHSGDGPLVARQLCRPRLPGIELSQPVGLRIARARRSRRCCSSTSPPWRY